MTPFYVMGAALLGMLAMALCAIAGQSDRRMPSPEPKPISEPPTQFRAQLTKPNGESAICDYDDIQIEIDGEGMISLITPVGGTREFLVDRSTARRMWTEAENA